MFSSFAMIGCGNMGSALLNGWHTHASTHAHTRWHVLTRSSTPPLPHGVLHTHTLQDIPADIDCVIIAIKPQQLAQMLPTLYAHFGVKPVYITLAAGRNVAFYHQMMSPHCRIVRAMPNTPVAISKGVSGLFSHTIAAHERQAVSQLFAQVSSIYWLDDEAQLHALTATSGSGSAYVFYMMECYTEAACALGLDATTARQLVQDTFAGAALYAQNSAKSLEALRAQVTSPAGTTHAALHHLMQDDTVKTIISRSMLAAVERSQELSSAE